MAGLIDRHDTTCQLPDGKAIMGLAVYGAVDGRVVPLGIAFGGLHIGGHHYLVVEEPNLALSVHFLCDCYASADGAWLSLEKYYRDLHADLEERMREVRNVLGRIEAVRSDLGRIEAVRSDPSLPF